MRQSEIERTAEEVLSAHGLTSLSVDPLALARQEGIHVLAGRYGECFDARIEHRDGPGGGRYYLFYAEEEPPHRPASAVRFSVAHELGHFFLAPHRDYLLSGTWHGRHAGFIYDDRLEREADSFAKALLAPR